MSKREEEEKLQAQQEALQRLRMPKRSEGEMFGVVTQLVGSNNIRIMCEDGTERICRIPGKLMKRVWLRLDDIVLVKLWSFQPSKADVVWRYMGMQVEHLKNKGFLSRLNL